MEVVLDFFKKGGPFMIVNLFALGGALAVIAERAFMLFFSFPINEKDFSQQVAKNLQAGNLDAALKACTGDRALSVATRNLLKLMRNGYESPMLALEESIILVKARVQHRVSWLWSIANIATLIGLVGTIIGLIGAFASISGAAAGDRANILSEKISEAMNNTAFGLMIAVLCISAHLALNNQAVKIIEGLEHSLFQFINLHAQWRKGTRSEGGGNTGAR